MTVGFTKRTEIPDGQNPGGYKFLGRTDNAYLTLAYPWGDIWVGRFQTELGARWPDGHDDRGQRDHLSADRTRSGQGKPHLPLHGGRTVVGRRAAALTIVGNRLDYHRGNFWVSVGQSALYSGESAVLRLFNPLEFIFLDHSSNYDRQEISGNVMLNAMFWARVGEATLYGEFALDDFDLNPRTGGADRPIEPTSYQLSLGGRYLGVSDRLEFGFDYRRVSALSYRSGVVTEIWMHLDRGLADPWSDYDRLTLRADLYPSVEGLRISPVLQFQRSGEGDYRNPFPERDELLPFPGIFRGVVETTRRVALQGRYQPRSEVFLEWDLGRSFISKRPATWNGSSEGRFLPSRSASGSPWSEVWEPP